MTRLASQKLTSWLSKGLATELLDHSGVESELMGIVRRMECELSLLGLSGHIMAVATR